MRYIALIPASILVVSLLVGLELVPRQSAPTLVTANGSPAAVASEPASDSSVTAEARVNVESGNGGEGESTATPGATPNPATVARVEGERPIPPAEAVIPTSEPQSGGAVGSGVTNAGSTPAPSATALAGEAQMDERLSSTQEDAGSIPAASATLWNAIESAFPPSEQETAYWVAMCESSGNPDAVGLVGEQGAFQVRPEYHGPVPADLYGQAEQAAAIVAEQGWSPWSCAK